MGPQEVCKTLMYSANGGHHGDFGNCTATGTGRVPAPLNISSGNLVLAGIHRILAGCHFGSVYLSQPLSHLNTATSALTIAMRHSWVCLWAKSGG